MDVPTEDLNLKTLVQQLNATLLWRNETEQRVDQLARALSDVEARRRQLQQLLAVEEAALREHVTNASYWQHQLQLRQEVEQREEERKKKARVNS